MLLKQSFESASAVAAQSPNRSSWETKHFGKYTEKEFERLSKAIKQEMYKLAVSDVEISGA